MQAKHIERLEQVVRVLRELPRGKKFDMGDWMICGTVGCAIGWTASDPWFRRRGFRLEEKEYEPGVYFPKFKQEIGYVACARFFGITLLDAEKLFDPSYYRDSCRKRDVIRRIEGFIAKHKQ